MPPYRTTDEPHADRPPRLVPNRLFPHYTHIPGATPHPVGDPAGHSFGRQEPACDTPDPANWRACERFLWGVDLFNAGYYWEAHEAWEAVWIAAGRRGPTADFLKALIKLAAAGVKLYEQNPSGARRHLRRARELFVAVNAASPPDAGRMFGLDAAALGESAGQMLQRTLPAGVPGQRGPTPVLAIALRPR